MTPFLQIGEHNAVESQPKKTKDKESFIYQSKIVEDMMKLAMRASSSNNPVFIVGGKGSGKKSLALEIHKKSQIRFGPVFSLHCQSLSEKVLEAELFGFKGDETTASSEGALRKADGGTLVLDDVSVLPLYIQEKLYQYIQAGVIYPVGSKTSVPVHTRIIFTINKQDELNGSSLSKTVYEQIDPIRIEMPHLSERKEDIADLTRYFLSMNLTGSKSHPKQKTQITAPAIDALKCYKWPGNVRELRNICERAQIFCQNNQVTVNDLPRHILDANECAVQIKYDPSLKLSDINRLYILNALKHFPSKKRAAQALGITVKTLYNRLHEYGIFDRYAIHSRD